MRHRRGLLSVALTAIVFGLPVTAYADSQIPTMSPNAAAPAVNTVAATTVEIKNFTYTPRYFTVPPGATVTVRNDDQVVHTISGQLCIQHRQRGPRRADHLPSAHKAGQVRLPLLPSPVYDGHPHGLLASPNRP